MTEATKWDSDEIQRQKNINQIAINKQKEEQAKADAAQARLAAQARQAAQTQAWQAAQTQQEVRAWQADHQAAQAQLEEQQATQAAAQAEQTAQKAKAAIIGALQSQIDTLRTEQDRLPYSYGEKYEDLSRQINALQSQVNSLK